MWVSPFRDLRIDGYLLLPEAFRSLSRLSSALSAKASALCPFCLTFRFRPPSVRDGGLILIADKFLYRCLPILRVTQASARSRDKGGDACILLRLSRGSYMRRSRDRGTSVPRCTCTILTCFCNFAFLSRIFD